MKEKIDMLDGYGGGKPLEGFGGGISEEDWGMDDWPWFL